MTSTPPNSVKASYTRAATLGFATGLRSATPLAVLTAAAQDRGGHPSFAADSQRPLSLLRSRRVLILCGLAVAGEFIVDKLPFVPSRLTPGVFGERLVAGALVGAVVGHEAHLSPRVGAAVGAAASGAGAAAGAVYRTRLARATRLPDAVWAVAEDVLALAISMLALRRISREYSVLTTPYSLLQLS